MFAARCKCHQPPVPMKGQDLVAPSTIASKFGSSRLTSAVRQFFKAAFCSKDILQNLHVHSVNMIIGNIQEIP